MIFFRKCKNGLKKRKFPDISFRRVRVYREKKHPSPVLCGGAPEGGAFRSRVRRSIAARLSQSPLGEGDFWVQATWTNCLLVDFSAAEKETFAG